MRLIQINDGGNDNKPELKDYTHCQKKPPYVILSHRWLSQEDHGGDITFQEFNDDNARKDKKRNVAFEKLNKAIEIAKRVGATHIWIDSCCINRESSSELSEALNSMYRYYEEAELCIVHLRDFENKRKDSKEYNFAKEEWFEREWTLQKLIDHLRRRENKMNPAECDFSKENWFKRGWTLQELIAPKEVIFFDKNWQLVGTRDKLAGDIHKVTKIPEDLLRRNKERFHYSVAQRMSWAAERETTREEDMSYSLFGLFGVNLPPIYGEGARNAFLRLQEEIMRKTNDMSLFAWKADPNDGWGYSGILSRSPKEFQDAGDIVREGSSCEFSMTNKGLKIIPLLSYRGDGTYLLRLNGVKNKKGSKRSLSIVISGTNSGDSELYQRKPEDLGSFDNDNLTIREAPIYIIRDERYPETSSASSKKVSNRTREAQVDRGSSRGEGEESSKPKEKPSKGSSKTNEEGAPERKSRSDDRQRSNRSGSSRPQKDKGEKNSQGQHNSSGKSKQ